MGDFFKFGILIILFLFGPIGWVLIFLLFLNDKD